MKNKKLTPPRCIRCPQGFNRQEAVCWRCGSCQKCGQVTVDKFGSECIHCSHYLPISRYNKTGHTFRVRIHPHRPFQQ